MTEMVMDCLLCGFAAVGRQMLHSPERENDHIEGDPWCRIDGNKMVLHRGSKMTMSRREIAYEAVV